MQSSDVDTLVTGATGFIGRWLLLALTARGRHVAALVRRADERGPALKRWVAERGGDADRLLVVEGDVTREDLGLTMDFPQLADLFHLAAKMRFDLPEDEARRANVDGTVHAIRYAARAPRLRRFVAVGGYRLTTRPAWIGARFPLPASTRRRLYRTYGNYEASKYEAQLALEQLADELALPFTVVHPSGVIGDSRTGECTQTDGLGETVEALWRGKLHALAGTSRTFVPLVAVDYLADFLATVADRESTRNEELCVLDPSTPNLPELVAAMAAHLGVPAPRRLLPLGLVRRLPSTLTGLHREAVGFLSEDRYDVAAAEAHAAAVGLSMPPWRRTMERWLDHLVSTDFLRGDDDGRITRAAGSSTFAIGDPARADRVLLHGLPWSAESWRPLTDALREAGDGSSWAAMDLPGLGRSASADDDLAWLDALLGERSAPVTLVAHSLGGSLALRYALAHPGRVRELVLVAPFFLQRPVAWWQRWAPATALGLRFTTASSLQRQLLGRHRVAAEPHEAVAATVAQLGRPGVARRTAEALSRASRAPLRAQLREQLARVATPTTLVVGSEDPLEHGVEQPVAIIDGAGHNPHVSHPEAVAALLGSRARHTTSATPSRGLRWRGGRLAS